jgi:methylphosphotriester-DNA--protein-cysteine methyltransferase
MIAHTALSDKELTSLIKNHEIILAGNSQLKIFGTLRCSSGKRMKKENRVFFTSKKEAIQNKFRPCGHCMKSL